MSNRTSLVVVLLLLITLSLAAKVSGQGVQPYPSAATDLGIHLETPMPAPPAGAVFSDPDFGSQMVRVTDRTTNFKFPGTYLRTEASGQANEWSADTRKFYVLAKGGWVLAFAFDPSTMAVTSLPKATPGQGLLLPLRPGPTFSVADQDVIYGTTNANPLTITKYRFSTGISAPVVDTRNCGLQPPLTRTAVSDDDVSLSAGDRRVAISEGGAQFGQHMFVVVYDKNLGCRWYNTQTGQIGGQWGASGNATISATYTIRHSYLARSGNYVRILTDVGAWYVWNLATLNISVCTNASVMNCGGYGVGGYNTYVNSAGKFDDMQTVKRPLNNLSQLSFLFPAVPPPGNWGQARHFTWSNVNSNDSTPVCGSSYSYDGDMTINEPIAQEIFCMETDGLGLTVWRFAHNRAAMILPYFNTQPLGSISMDGKFYLFTSDWDAQLGLGTDGTPRSDVFIVKLK